MFRVVQILFFISGWTALVYQIVWVRQMVLCFGSTIQAVSCVLAVFLGGLALGSLIAGRLALRTSRPLVLYSRIELLIGLHGAASLLLIREVSLFVGSSLPAMPGALLTATIVLVPAATLMGATLPLLTRACVWKSEHLTSRLTDLYAVNTLGAVGGCLGSGFLLIREYGSQQTLWFAAAGNLMLAVAALVLAQRADQSPAISNLSPESATASATSRTSSPHGRLVLGLAAFSSGCLFLAIEVLWTRLFQSMLTSNVLVYTTLAAAFLAGMAIAAAGCRWIRSAASLEPLLVATAALTAALILGSAVMQPEIASLLGWIRTTGLSRFSHFGLGSLATLFLLCLPAATLFGMVFPLIIRLACRDTHTAPLDLGNLLAWNTWGAITGTLATGFVLLPALGLNQCLLMIGIGYLLVAGLVARTRRQWGLCLGTLAAGVLVWLPHRDSADCVWFNGGFTQVSRIPPDDVLFVREGAQATVAVVKSEGQLGLLIDGTIVAETTRADLWDLLLKAHLPMLIHEDPRRVALVGLGAGVSLGAVLAHEIDHVDCAELCPEVVETLPWFKTVNRECWSDPRAEIHLDDGRHFLLHADRRYDVISVDPIDPPVCNQYSLEFLQLCHDRLAAGGIMVQWVPLFHMTPFHVRVIIETFADVFPDASLWYDGTSLLLFGVREGSLKIDVSSCIQRAARRPVGDSLRLIDSPAASVLLGMWVGDMRDYRAAFPDRVPITTDDRPFLEYVMLLEPAVERISQAQNLDMLLEIWSNRPLSASMWTGSRESIDDVERSRALMHGMLEIRAARMARRVDEDQRLWARFEQEFSLSPKALETLAPFLDE